MRSYSSLVISGDASLAQQSDAIDASQLYAASIQVIAASGLAGTIELYASNQPDFDSTYAIKIADAAFMGVYSGTLPFQDVCYKWLQLRWIPNGSMDALQVFLNVQGF